MQLSKYNILFSDKGNKYLFNTYSQKIVQLRRDTCETIEELENGENLQVIDCILKQKLLEYGIIVEDEKTESLETLKRECENLVMSDTLHITMMMTYNCNFNCIYCFQKHIPESFMSDATMEHVVSFVENEIKQNKLKRLYVEWFGGEPLIMKEKLLWLHKEFRELACKYKIPYYSRITTNGYELDIETFKELYRNHCFIYYISLDGTKEIQDKHRPHKNGKGSYEKIIHNLKLIREGVMTRNFRIEIRVNCMLDSLAETKQFILEYKKLFGADARFRLVLDIVQDWSEKTNCMQDELIEKDALAEIAQFAEKNNVTLANFTTGTLETQICQAAKRNAYSIFYDGKIIKCQMALEQPDYREMNEIGDIVGGVIESRRDKWVSGLFPEKCENCIALPMCFGKKCVFQTIVKKEECFKIREKLISQLRLEKALNGKMEVI